MCCSMMDRRCEVGGQPLSWRRLHRAARWTLPGFHRCKSLIGVYMDAKPPVPQELWLIRLG